MPSITFWNRLEPRARSNDLTNALAARVRDPAWFLARQWQLGEFRGEDAGSPAYVRIAVRTSRMVAWGPTGQPPTAIASTVPIEAPALAERFSPEDVSLAVELGQTFDRILVQLAATDLRPHYLQAFPIPASTTDDPRSARLRALWTGRTIDGIAVYVAGHGPWTPVDNPPSDDSLVASRGMATAVEPGPDDPPPTPMRPPGVPATVSQQRWGVAWTAVQQLMAWVDDVFGAPGPDDPPAWNPAQLEYELSVYAGAPTATGVTTTVLAATPDAEGDLEWFAFDGTTASISGVPVPTVTEIKRAVIPGPVRFRGMPNERFWDFEDGRVDFGALRPDRRNLASMILMDFMLVHGNDWFLVPFEQPVGTLCRTELTVVDVFGSSTPVSRADAVGGPTAPRWTMFSTAKSDGTPADFFLLPNTPAATVLDGPPIEEVRFLRDETANLVWAIEHATENHLGAPWLGHERAVVADVPPEPAGSVPLRYRLQTRVPEHWIPFQPVKLSTATSEIALELASLLGADAPPGTVPLRPTPRGKILAPRSVPSTTRYRVREEEVPREGTTVARIARWSRGVDGKSYLWLSRRRNIGRGEGWSGLKFDQAVDVPPLDSDHDG